MQREIMTAVKTEPWEKVTREKTRDYELEWANGDLAHDHTDALGCVEMLRQIGHPSFTP